MLDIFLLLNKMFSTNKETTDYKIVLILKQSNFILSTMYFRKRIFKKHLNRVYVHVQTYRVEKQILQHCRTEA